MEKTIENLENQNVDVNETSKDEGAVTITKAELQKMLQQESDKRVSQALKTAKANWESEMGSKIDNQLKDYEKRSQMTPEQLKQLDLDEKFKMLEQKEQEYQRMTKELEISNILSEKGLSTVLTKFVYDDDIEQVEQNIATIEQLVLGMVNEQVEKRISSSKPKVGVDVNGLTKEKFKNMTIVERSELFKTNPQLFKELSQ